MHQRYLERVVELIRVAPPLAAGGARLVSWDVHAIRGDATNSAAVHSSKAHVTEVISLYKHISLQEACGGDAHNVSNEDRELENSVSEFFAHRVYPDVQKVPSSRGQRSSMPFLKNSLRLQVAHSGQTRSWTYLKWSTASHTCGVGSCAVIKALTNVAATPR